MYTNQTLSHWVQIAALVSTRYLSPVLLLASNHYSVLQFSTRHSGWGTPLATIATTGLTGH